MRDCKEWQRLLHKKIQMEAATQLVEHTALKSYEIGDRVGLTSERVRQIKSKAIKKLKNTYRTKRLKTYL